MAETAIEQGSAKAGDRGRLWVVLYLATTGLVLLLMMLAGLVMHTSQRTGMPV